MKKKERDEHFAARIPGILLYHQTMLADGVRNRLLYKAVKQHVTSNTSFLDIGAGTGVWAILAAKLGAKRVVAIEIEECLIPIIYKHAQENGVADRIEIIHANSNDVKIRGKFDVIVSELFGGDALGHETMKSFVHIRDRFLAPDGVLIPQKLSMYAVPVHYDLSINDIPGDLPLKTEYFKSVRFNYGTNLTLADREKIEFLADPKKLVEVDFRTAEEAPVLENLAVTWKLKNLKKTNAIAVFNQSTFTDGIEMDSFGSQSWAASINEFAPFGPRSGVLGFRVTYSMDKTNWSVSLPSHPEERAQNFGPVFAFPRLRMAQHTTPYRRIRGKRD
jgi:SAM-dependent methyltransferase